MCWIGIYHSFRETSFSPRRSNSSNLSPQSQSRFASPRVKVCARPLLPLYRSDNYYYRVWRTFQLHGVIFFLFYGGAKANSPESTGELMTKAHIQVTNYTRTLHRSTLTRPSFFPLNFPAQFSRSKSCSIFPLKFPL